MVTAVNGEKRYKSFTGHSWMLVQSGEQDYRSLTRLLMTTGVLGVDGTLYKPTANAVLELLKWHAGGGAIVVIPMTKLALELGCGARLVRDRLKQLEDGGLILRRRNRAPGNLYTTEIVGPSPEPEATPLAPTQEHLLSVLASKSDEDGLVQTNEHELALAVGVSHDTALHSLISLRQLGYVSATIAEYGRPCIVKVLYDKPVLSKGVTSGNGVAVQIGYCLKCRQEQRMADPEIREFVGARGARMCAVGVCEACGTRVARFVSAKNRQEQKAIVPTVVVKGQEQGSDQNGQLVRFLQWQRDLRQQEQDKLDELIGDFTTG